MKIIYRLITVLLIAAGLFAIGSTYYVLNDGFTVTTITSHYPNDPRWDVHAISPEEKQEVDQALSQNYDYLAKGHQTFVFISADKKYVIKFLKFGRNRNYNWLKKLPLPSFYKERQAKRAEFKRVRMDSWLESWKIAFNDLQYENALLFVHINPTQNQFPTLSFKDKIGFNHQLDLDNMTFLIQRTATLVKPAIDEAMARNDHEAAKRYIDELIALFLSEYKRGFAETDIWVLRNTGYLGDRAVHIDLGRFVKDDKYKDPNVQKKEIIRKTTELRGWLTQKYPELIPYLDSKTY